MYNWTEKCYAAEALFISSVMLDKGINVIILTFMLLLYICVDSKTTTRMCSILEIYVTTP